MADDPGQEPPESRDERRRSLLGSVGRKVRRRLQAQQEGDRTLWFGLGTFGVVGWSVMIPTIIGIAVGVWLDERYSGTVSWTLTGLVVGVIVGCLNAWYWVSMQSRND